MGGKWGGFDFGIQTDKSLFMQLSTLAHQLHEGWSGSFPDLDSPTTLVIVFGAAEYADSPEAIKEITQSFPNSKVIGCSTAGEIRQDMVSDRSLAVAIARFERTELRSAFVDVSIQHSRKAGQELASQLKSPDLRGVMLISEGLDVNGSELIRGLTEGVGRGVPIFGGLAADGERFEKTWIVERDQLVSGRAGAIGFYGDSLSIDCASQGGWDIYGPERTISRSEGNVVYELDGEPVLELYRQYLGAYVEGLPASAMMFPIALHQTDEDMMLVRTVLSIDEVEGSMTFAGDMPQGAVAQLMRASFDRLIDGAEMAAKTIVGEDSSQMGNSPVLSLAVSCVGRRIVLGVRIEEELDAVLEGLPEGTEQIGFYSYGEISSTKMGNCYLYNQTMTLAYIAEHE